MSERELRDRVVVVSGAGSGLGQATAHAFARAGSAVACLDLRATAAEQTAGDIEAAGGRSLALACDVADAEAIAEAIAAVERRYGRIDVLVNSAAIDHTLSLDELSVAQIDRVLDVNLRGPFLMSKAVWPAMRARRYGHIVNIASTAATRAWANASPYHASKWGLMGLGRSLGVEGRPYNIRVTTVVPGGMRTHFFDRFADQGIPMPDPERLQDPANVAAAIVFAVCLPQQSVLQELLITPLDEPSWP